jgi:hypothetical protein
MQYNISSKMMQNGEPDGPSGDASDLDLGVLGSKLNCDTENPD